MEKLAKTAKYYIRVVLNVYLFLLIVIYPYYAPDGYIKLGANKAYFFRTVGIECLILMLPAAVFLFLFQGKHTMRKRLSVTDRAMLLYAVAVFLSYACTEWKRQAFWGAEGWSTGFMFQLMLVAIYFYVSRFSEKLEIWYVVFLVVSLGVFLTGILNRFSVYLFWRDSDAPAAFISTIGNPNWFCGYWSVVFPIGLVLYWVGAGDVFWKRALLILYLVIGFMAGIVQGSSSGFLALGAVFLALFFLSFGENGRFLRWLELLLLFVVSALFTGVIKRVFPTALNYQNEIEEWVTQYTTGVFLLGVTSICYAAARYMLIKMHKSVRAVRKRVNKVLIFRVLLAGLLLAIMVVCYLVIYFQTGEASYAVHWGNGRGAAWMAAVKAFAAMPLLQKVVGIGPDCFDCYVYGSPDIADGIYAVFGMSRLTNAHNELITALVNTGICGGLSYALIFLTAMRRQFGAGKQTKLLLISAICTFSYAIHNMVSFQNVVSTPVVFILIGFGERMLRKE